MAFGILDTQDGAHAPGTIILDEKAANIQSANSHLKHGKGSNSHLVLEPQPSNDPNDPLNWPQWYKELHLWVVVFGTILNGALPGPLLNAGFVEIASELERPLVDLVKTSGYLLIVTGASGPFVSAISRKWGKRPVYILSSLMAIIAVIVGEVATTYSALLASRVVHGLAVSAYESLTLASVGDLFFIHERGPRVAIIMVMITAIGNGISIIAGPITSRLGWHFNYHILLPFVVVQFIAVVLLVEETAYNRNPRSGLNHDLFLETAPGINTTTPDKPDSTVMIELQGSDTLTIPKRKAFLQRLALCNGPYTRESFPKMVLASIAIVLNVGAAFSIIVTGVIIAWYVAVALISSVIFSVPPYSYTAAGVGYVSTGPLIGGVLGSFFIGATLDPTATWMTRRNKGVYEPEFRLPLVSVGAVFSIAGLCGFGHAIQDQRNVYLISFLWGMLLFGMTILSTAILHYVLDALSCHSTEIFIMNMVFKNFFYYGVTNYIVQWYAMAGPASLFDTLGGITAAMCCLTIPMYIFGKRYRSGKRRELSSGIVSKVRKVENDELCTIQS